MHFNLLSYRTIYVYTTHPLHLDFEPEPGHASFVRSNLVKTFSLRVLREKEAFVARGLFVFAYTFVE